MADNFADFYTGSMAPPLRLPGGGYAPAPSSQSQMSPEEIYQGIYGEPLQLTSRSVQTVPVPTQAATDARFGVGAGMRGAGEATYQSPKVMLPNANPGPNPVAKTQDRLPAMPAGLPLAGAFASGKAGLGASGFGSGSLTAKASDKGGSGVIKLVTEPMSEVSGQNTANSFGKPVQGPSGKTYYPSNTPMSGVRAPYDPKAADKYSGKIGQDNRGPLSQLLGLKTSGLGGLLGGLFGGFGQQRQGLGGLLGGVPAAPTTPQFYSNGVANPDYRNYSPGQSEGGGVMPSSSYSGGFTDSLGGTYYDRHL